MRKLITATECIKQLKQSGVYKGTLPYFTRLVDQGYIPSHKKEGSTKRWYKYEEAKDAINNMADPTRQHQREANETRRREIEGERIAGQITELLTKMEHIEVMRPEMFDHDRLDPEDAATFENDIYAHNAINLTIMDLTHSITALLDELSGGTFRSSIAELKVIEHLSEYISTAETMRELYGISD